MTPAAPLAAATRDWLQQEGARWFPDLPAGALDVSPIGEQQRPRCTLLRYRLQGDGAAHEVLVKARRPEPAHAVVRRPRLALESTAAPDALAHREQLGLAAIAQAVAGSDPMRFGAIRPLGVLEGHAALAMEFLPAPTLRDVVLLAARRGRRVPDQVWRNAGSWLALFQQRAPGTEQLPARVTTRDEVGDLFQAYAEHLGAHAHDPGLTAALSCAGERAAASLPAQLDLAPVHHDFVARNVLVDGDGRVTLLDPMMSARVPVHEDVGRFLVGLRSNGVQLATRDLAVRRSHLDRYERAFLDGYAEMGGDVGPGLRVIHALVLLDRWAAHVAPAAGPRRWRAEQVARWQGIHLRRQALQLLGPYL